MIASAEVSNRRLGERPQGFEAGGGHAADRELQTAVPQPTAVRCEFALVSVMLFCVMMSVFTAGAESGGAIEPPSPTCSERC